MKSALITGATSGIGEATARFLYKQGYRLCLTGRVEEKLKSLKKELAPCQVLVADLSTEEGRERVMEVLEKNFFDLLINNAGFGLYKDLIDQSGSQLHEMLEVNCLSVVLLTQKAAKKALELKKECTILNVSSVAGEFPTPGMAVYGATKAFVTSFSEATDVELQGKGVRVLANCPGRVATQFSYRASGGVQKKKTSMHMTPEYAAEQIWKQIEAKQPKRVYNSAYRWSAYYSKFFKRHLMHKMYQFLRKM